MSTTSIPGGGDHNVTVYGNGTVIAGDGNNFVRLGSGSVVVGDGNDTINLLGRGRILQTGALGHDTINLGVGNTSISVEGNATVNSFNHFSASGLGRGYGGAGNMSMQPSGQTTGGATIAGGVLNVNHLNGVTQEVAVSGTMTLVGGSARSEFIGGSGVTVMKGGSGHDTFIGGSGSDTMSGSGSHDVFQFLTSAQGGHHVITNFVAGDQLNVDGHSLSYLLANNQVTTHDGNTYITGDEGKTTIELQGVTVRQGPQGAQVGYGIAAGFGAHGGADHLAHLNDSKIKPP